MNNQPQELSNHPAIVKMREEHFANPAIAEPFTLTVVGDIIQTNPITQRTDPAVRSILDPILESDVAFGNMESNFGDYRNAIKGIGGLQGCKEVAEDVKKMGFGLVARSSNHSTDQGVEEMLKSNQFLQEAGVVYAGTGTNLEDARAPQYFETPKGRIGLVAMTMSMRGRVDNQSSRSADCGMEMASYQAGNRNGAAGINFLRCTPSIVLTPELYEGILKIKQVEEEESRKALAAMGLEPEGKDGDRIGDVLAHLYGKITDANRQTMLYTTMFEVGDNPCGLSWHMNEDDLRLNLRSIRQGKEWSDFMIASIHTHDSATRLRTSELNDDPADYLVELAHAALDNGADIFVATGPHRLRGIEIYRGKPIFYSLASFVYQLWGTPAGPDRFSDTHLDSFYSETTETEMNMHAWPPLSLTRNPDPKNNIAKESVSVELQYDGGELHTILLRPIEFGYDAPISQCGIPRRPNTEVALRILGRMKRMSEKLGTEIVIENELGYIRF